MVHFILFIILHCTQLIASESSITEQIFSPDEVLEIKKIVDELIDTYPPDKYHYVGLGRSPTPVMAYLEVNQISTTNIPISGLQRGLTSPYLIRKFHDHLQYFLPDKVNLNGKKIVVIDYSVGGGSITHSMKHIKRYLREADMEGPKAFVMAKNNDNIDKLKLNILKNKQSMNNYHIVKLKNRFPILSKKFSNEEYDKYAQYDSFYLPTGVTNEVTRKKEYESFKTQLKKMITSNEDCCKSENNSILNQIDKIKRLPLAPNH